MDEIAYKAGDMVTYIRHDGSEVTGEVLTAEVMYWVAWPDSAVKNLCRDVELRPRRLAVGDTFGSDDRSADELPVGTVVLDDCDHGADAWICRGQGWWGYTGGTMSSPLPHLYTYKIIYIPEVEA
jgi:hypothetical protein